MRGLTSGALALAGWMGLGAAVQAAPDVATSRDQAPPQAVPFIQDDYPAALARAKADDLPLFVEAWAPW
jgi:hypothetical protein